MKLIFSVLVSFAFFFGSSQVFAQAIDSKITCVFVYNFTKYIKWPPAAESGDFVIGILGNTPVEGELTKLTGKLKVSGTRTIVIKKINSASNAAALQSCNILYISNKESKALKEINATIGDAPVLMVSEGMGLTSKGSCISIYIDEDSDKIKLELNKKVLESHKLKASSELLNLAVLI